MEWNEFYKKHIKKDIHLTRRLIAGIKQHGQFDLGALTKFYSIFINRIASLQEKIKFLMFYFIPFGQEKIEF